jgi:hypothetical protein
LKFDHIFIQKPPDNPLVLRAVFRRQFLKFATLDLLSEMVALMVSSLSTNFSGGGRKSLITRT